MSNLVKNLISVLLIFLIISAVFALFSPSLEKTKQIDFSQLVADLNQGKIKKISVSSNDLEITYQDGTLATSLKETEGTLSQSLVNYGADKTKLASVDIELKKESALATWLGPILWFVLPLLLFVLFFWMMLRQARTGVNQAFDFTRARAKLFGPGAEPKEKVTFKDIAGVKEAKEELKEVIDFLKNPKKYLQMGAKIPRGVLLIGAPGTGKTMLAKAVANEGGVAFFSISGSEFIELFVGVGASRVRNLFEQAKKAGKAIIFIDEIDSIGKVRGVGITGGHEEREQTLNQILAEMDGIGREEGLIIMGATNRPEYLDPALLRPGRFDRRIVLDLPDVNDREEILKIHCRGKPLSLDVNLREISERTPGFSGADLANLANEAAILAARREKNQVSQIEFLESIEKVLLGPERKSHILSKKEKEIAAFHEAGHALVSSSLPEAEPVRKISIIARGMAAGYTLKMPSEERKIRSKSEFLAELATLLGGYCAEKLKFREITTGAGNDLEKASELARKLVKEYGMSSLGPVVFGEKEELAFLGQEFSGQRNYSEEVATKIDKEVARFIEEAEKTATNILKKRGKTLDKIAKTLIEKETIEREEFESLIKKGKREIIPARRLSTKKKAPLKIRVRRV
jgi:cell division protease FtsH